MLLVILAFLSLLSPAFSQSYLPNIYKYTGCQADDCSNSKCMSGYRINTDWAHWNVDDSFGTSYGFCGWPWENRCKCNACNRGYFDSLTDCVQCPAGSYQPNYAQNSCSVCDSGKVSSSDRQSCITCTAGTRAFLDSCATCPAGTFSSEGSTTCSLCSAGSYSGEGSTSCTECQPGKYAFDTTTPCENCAAGKYSEASAAVCTPCSPGENSVDGASSCNSCTAGRYALGSASECTACSAGTYSAEGAAACIPCSSGKKSADAASSCTSCAAGRYSLGAASSCTVCPAGTYSAEDATVCTPCGNGKWSDEEASTCTSCVPGKYRLSSPSGCSDCVGGTYSDSEGSTVCSICDPGYFATPGSTACSLCQAGRYSLIPSETCSQCQAGKYSRNDGATSCSGCSRGKFSTEGSAGCTDCPPNTNSVEEAGSCYALAGEFATCPTHPAEGDIVDNKCYYLHEGDWKSVDEGESSPFGSNCVDYAFCEHTSNSLHDRYYLSCVECEAGKVAVGYNSATQVRGNCSSPTHYPQKCVDSSSFSSCPSDPLKSDSCHYFYRGKWEDVGGNDPSAFSDSCTDYAVCGATYEDAKNSYFVLCTQCAEGKLQYTRSSLDNADGLPSDGLPPGGEDLCGKGQAISYCYDPQEFQTCPSGGRPAENLLIDCQYLGTDGGTVKGGESSPFSSTCDKYELISMQEGGILEQGSQFVIGCTKCKDGFQPGLFLFQNGTQYIGTCYQEVGPGTSGDFSVCNVGGSTYGKDVECSYLSGTSGDQWINVPWESSGPGTMADGCKSFTVCSTTTTDTSIEYKLMCSECKDNHEASATNTVIQFDGCGVTGDYPTQCDLVGERTSAPTASPTQAPTPTTSAPTPSPTVDQEQVIEQVDSFLSWLSRLANEHLELFMLGVAALIIFIGICVYKCYERDKLKNIQRWEDEGGSMFSFDMESIESGRRQGGSSTYREVGIQPGMRSGRSGGGGYGRGESELSLMRNSSRIIGSRKNNNNNDNYDDSSVNEEEAADQWVERLDPNGKTFYENKKTRRATWTNRGATSMPLPEHEGAVGNPMHDDDSGAAKTVPKNGLERTRSNTRGHANVPKLSKKIPGAPPPPVPPPVGWNRAVDQKGREYFWEVETGRTVWRREDCV